MNTGLPLARDVAICYTLRMQSEELLLQEALDAIKQENIPQARELMTRLLQRNRTNAEYWVLMSALVDTVKERDYCLREAHRLDPSNPTAIHGLRIAGVDIADPQPPPPLDPLKTNWKTSLEVEQPPAKTAVRPRTSASSWAILGILAVGLSIAMILVSRGNRYRPDTSPILKFSLTPPATATLPTTPTPVLTGLAPLWTLLEATYTSTPIYAATPHKITEAYQAAMKAYSRKDWAAALEFFKQVQYSEPSSADIPYHIGEIYRFQGLVAEALKAYEESIRANPAYAPAYIGKGRVLAMSSPPDQEQAQKQFEKALEFDPRQYEALLELANLRLNKLDAAGALDYLAQIPPDAPASVEVEITRARAYLLNQQPDLAIETALVANQIDLTSLPVYKLLAQAYQENHQVDASIVPLETYLAYEPGDAGALAMMAQAMLAAEEYSQALDYAEKALKLDEKSLPALLARAEILFREEKIDEAAADFNAALRLDKKSFGANLGIARIQISKTLYGSAYEYIRVANDLAESENEKALVFFWRAQALIGLKEYKAATADLESLFKLPQGVLPADLRSAALSLYKQVITPTPTLTPTKAITTTRTAGITPTPTPSPTNRPSPTPTPRK